MTKNLLIRKLSPEVSEILEEYKRVHYIKVNTDAACEIIAQHPKLMKEIEELKSENNEMSRRITRLELTIMSYLKIKNECERYLNQLKELTNEE